METGAEAPSDPFQALPLVATARIFDHLTLSEQQGAVPLVCKAWHTVATQRLSSRIHVNLHSITSGCSFAAWLAKQSSKLEQLRIEGIPLVTAQPRTAMWAALVECATTRAASSSKLSSSAGCKINTNLSLGLATVSMPSATCNGHGLGSGASISSGVNGLRCLALAMPLATVDEVALLGCLVRQAPTLTNISLCYTQPSSSLCFENAAAAVALASATQLLSLSITGAALHAALQSLGNITQLTHLECTAAAPFLAAVVSRLLHLRHLSVTSKALPCTGREGLTLALANALSTCSHLTTLQLVGFKASDTGIDLLSGLAQLRQLQSLELAGSLLQAEQLMHVSSLSALTHLCLASNDLSNAVLNVSSSSSDSSSILPLLLPSLQQLKELDVSGCRIQLRPAYCYMTDVTSLHAGAHRFRFHPNLITSADLCGISMLSQRLQALDLSCNKLECSSLKSLSALTRLTALNLAENDLSYEQPAESHRAHLIHVTSPFQQGSDCGCSIMAAAAPGASSAAVDQAAGSSKAGVCSSSMRWSACCHCANHPSLLQYLSPLQQLQHLDLSSCGLKDITPLAHLSGCLTHLKLGFSGFWRHHYNTLTANSFVALGKLTGLRHLDLHYCRGYHSLLPAEASTLGQLVQLTHLDVSGCFGACWRLTQSGHELPQLQQLLMLLQDHASLPKVVACCTGLSMLHMSDGGQQINSSVASLAPLQSLSGLAHLSMASLEDLSSATDVTLLKCLRHLKLYSGQGIQASQAAELSGMTQLTCLDLRHSGLAAAVLKQLRMSLPETWVQID